MLGEMEMFFSLDFTMRSSNGNNPIGMIDVTEWGIGSVIQKIVIIKIT